MNLKQKRVWDYLSINPQSKKEDLYNVFKEYFKKKNPELFMSKNGYRTCISRWYNQYFVALKYFKGPEEEYDEGKCRIITLKRDNYTCRVCGFKPARIVHHINSKNFYPEYRFDPENLITLCEKCHNDWHTGNK